MGKKRLDELCSTFKSDILVNKLEKASGEYPVFGAKGSVACIDSFQQEKPYISIIKWGAGVGRAEKRPAYSSIVATMLGVIPNSDVNIDWLCYLLQSMNLEQYSTNAVVPNIYFKDYCDVSVNVPSFTDQEEIATTLGRVQRIIAHREEQLCAYDELVKARFVEMFGDPRVNPYGYDRKELGKTCKVITGNTPSRKASEYYGDYMEWIKTDNIVSGLLNPTEAAESLSESGVEEGRSVDKNAILMACIAGSIASIGRVCVTDRRVAFNQQINAIVPEQYNTLFLYILLQVSKDYLVEDINMALKGILSKSKLEEKVFIVPPLELQNQFAKFIEQVDKSKVVIQESLAETRLLFDSLLQRWFG